MHRPLFLAFLLMAIAPLANAGETKPSTAAMKEQLQTVIRGQLEALRKGDYAGAYRFAAPGIREQFPLEAFETMVKSGYPVIAQNEDAVFGLTLDDGDKAVVNVRIVARDKVPSVTNTRSSATGRPGRLGASSSCGTTAKRSQKGEIFS